MTRDAVAPVIRPLAAGEWRELRDVRIRALEDSPDAFSFTAVQARQQSDAYWQQWAASADDPGRRVFVVHGPEVLEGLGSARLLDARGQIGAVWLSPRLRGTGLGGRLFDATCAFLVDLGPEAIVLHVTETNLNAIALYRSRGFALTGQSELLRDGSPLRSLEMVLNLPHRSP